MTNNYISMRVKNLGPLKSECKLENEKIGPLHTIIFARNGSGKTFISRAFSAIEKHQQQESVSGLDSLISFGETSSSFSFKCQKEQKQEEDGNSFLLNLAEGEDPQFKISSEWKVHVFNQEFIDENIAQESFSLSKSIPGEIIIGAKNIEIDKLENENKQISVEADEIKNRIRSEINEYKNQLNKNKDFTRIKEFSDITLENVLSSLGDMAEEFPKLLETWEKIKDLKDDLKILVPLSVKMNSQDFLTLSNLLNKVAISSIVEDSLKQFIEGNESFVKDGLSLWEKKNDECPFCKQSIKQDDTIKLIQSYKNYLAAEEASLVSEVKEKKRILEEFKINLETLKNNYYVTAQEYQEQSKYFSSIDDKELEKIAYFDRLLKDTQDLINCTQEKIENKKKNDFKVQGIIDKICDDLRALNEDVSAINKEIGALEIAKKHIKDEKINNRKRLCQAVICKLYVNNKEDIVNLKDKETKIKNNKERINKLLAEFKKLKKEEVDKSFQKLLCEFFDSRYTYDVSSGKLKYNETYPINSAKRVISEGEKSVIAFAHYISLIHKVVQNKEDYNRVFLVIDDPISSMDFNFVYHVAHIIRDLKEFIPEISNSVRFIILTHNQEFANIIICNNIAKSQFYLENGKFQKLQTEVFLPYDEHLKHVYGLAKGTAVAEFYSANALRHVLETISLFKYPNKPLKDGLLKEKFFQEQREGECYTLVNDFSHGRPRSSGIYTEENLRKIASLVINYIDREFKGQLERFESN